jgi:hypothetical protein
VFEKENKHRGDVLMVYNTALMQLVWHVVCAIALIVEVVGGRWSVLSFFQRTGDWILRLTRLNPHPSVGREKDISGSYHSQSFNNNRVLYVSYYCTTTPLDFDGLNDIHDSFSNTSSPQ